MDLTTLVALAVAAVAGIVLLERIIVDTRLGMQYAIVGTAVTITISESKVADVAGFAIEYNDLVFGLLLIAGVARLFRSPRIRDGQGLTVIVLLVLIWSLYRGAQAFDPQAAINEGRKYIYLFGGMLYLAPITLEDQDLRETFARWWVGLGCWLSFVAVFRWVAQSVGLSGGMFGDATNLRSVGANSAIIIAQAALISMIAGRDGPKWMQQATPILLVVTLLVQHRTVWIVLIVCLAVLVMRNRAVTRRLGAAMAGVALLGIVLVMTVFAGNQIEVADDLANSSSNLTTFEWRVAGWNALIFEEGRTFEEYLLGAPFGTGWERELWGQTWTFSPHNFYVESQLRLGAVGVSLLTLLHVLPIRRLGRHGWKYESLSTETLQILSITLLVYYVTYTPDAVQSMMIGMIMAAGWTPEPARAPTLRRPRNQLADV